MTFTHIGQTARMQAAENPVADGSKLGETAVATKPQGSSEIARWLSERSPADVDRAAVSRAKSHGADLAVRYEGRYPEDGPSYVVAVDCDVSGSPAQRKAALEDLQRLQEPAPVRQIEDWLAELSVLASGRNREGVEASLMLSAYTSRLRAYPADVVRNALLSKSWTWFPSWAELEKVCGALAGPRHHMIAALKRGPKPPEREYRRPTADERKAIQSLVEDKFPNVPRSWKDAAVRQMWFQEAAE